MRTNLSASQRDTRRMGNAVMPVMVLLVGGIVWIHVAPARWLLRRLLATPRGRVVLAVLLCLGSAMCALRHAAPDDALAVSDPSLSPSATAPIPRLCDGGSARVGQLDRSEERPRESRRRARSR